MQVKLKVLDARIANTLPAYETIYSAGLDLRACIDKAIDILPDQTILVPSGVSVFIDNPSFCGMLLPRSGLGHKHGIVLGNLVGLIDADYQGQILVSLWNRSKQSYTIKPLDRIAQLVIVPIVQVSFQIVDEFVSTHRGERGFGSTGD